jgi:hypothetical protein
MDWLWRELGRAWRQSGQDKPTLSLFVKTYDPGTGWECRICVNFEVDNLRPDQCSACGARRIRKFDSREELVRLAEQQDVEVRL